MTFIRKFESVEEGGLVLKVCLYIPYFLNCHHSFFIIDQMEASNEISLMLLSPKHQKKKRVVFRKPITMQILKEKIGSSFQLPPEEKVVKVVDNFDVDIETDEDCQTLKSGQELRVTIEVTRRILIVLNYRLESARRYYSLF